MIRYARHGAAFESRTDLASVGELDWGLELGRESVLARSACDFGTVQGENCAAMTRS